jgi:UDP-N-acetylmuramyl pentapeptide phosphotransferase/UDP-N-acetylglucosamine-1-phosphate transferase
MATVLAVPVMAVWVAAYVNAFNFMDGINGISGLTGLVSGVAYSLMGLEFGSGSAVIVGAALAGASLAFLPFNLPSAKVFLGDVGSYSLGFVIAALGWIVWSSGAPLALAIAPTAVYLADTGATLVRRYRRGAPLTEAHREHSYQRLTAGGRSHVAVALTVAGAESLVVALVWWGYREGLVWLGILGTLAALAGYAAAPRFAVDRLRA